MYWLHFCCCDKIPDKNNLRERGFISLYRCRGMCPSLYGWHGNKQGGHGSSTRKLAEAGLQLHSESRARTGSGAQLYLMPQAHPQSHTSSCKALPPIGSIAFPNSVTSGDCQTHEPMGVVSYSNHHNAYCKRWGGRHINDINVIILQCMCCRPLKCW